MPLPRKWSFLSSLVSVYFVYSQSQQWKTCSSLPDKRNRITLPLHPQRQRESLLAHASRPLWSQLLISTATLEGKNSDDNGTEESVLEKSKANFLELQDQFVRGFLAKIPSVENFHTLSAADLRNSLANLWDTMTLSDIVDSVKDIKDTVANPELNEDAVVRLGQELSQEEQNYLEKRMEYQRNAFASFIGVDAAEVELADIPVIGVASSGGGLRATLGLTGYLKAMKDSGVLDCVTYMAGISGSCWALSLYYSVLGDCDPDTMIDYLKSHVGVHIGNVAHILSLAAASTQNAKLLMQGIGQRYLQQSTVNLVDLFGTLLGATLYTRPVKKSSIVKDMNKETDPHGDNEVQEDDETIELLLDKKDMKLSGQSRFIEDGRQPMPIYCVVRQDLEDKVQSEIESEREKSLNNELSPHQMKEIATHSAQHDNEEDELLHRYQWFEFNPFEFGSDEVNAWIPMWAFGRKFDGGKNTERLPEQRLDSLLGMFGSAFAASVVHFYQEIRGFLPISSLRLADETIGKYEKSLSVYHPISPAVYPNPFYHLNMVSEERNTMFSRLINSEQIHLMDGGMDNNIPFFPLINQRKVDIILAVDLSADIQTAPHFERAEGYVKRRGIEGWPSDAGWPKEESDSNVEEVGNELMEKMNSQQQQQQTDDNASVSQKVDLAEKVNSDGKHHVNNTSLDHDRKEKEKAQRRYSLGPCTVFPGTATKNFDTDEGKRMIVLVYFPFIGDEEFDPQTCDYCSTWNFVYEPQQVEQVVGLAQANFTNNLDKVRTVFRAVWERKKRLRLQQRDVDALANIFLFP